MSRSPLAAPQTEALNHVKNRKILLLATRGYSCRIRRCFLSHVSQGEDLTILDIHLLSLPRPTSIRRLNENRISHASGPRTPASRTRTRLCNQRVCLVPIPPVNTPMKLLIVDADTDLCLGLREFFRKSGYDVDFEFDGEAGVARAESGGYELVIADALLPGINAVELLRRIRSNLQVPVLVLSTKADQDDRVAALEMGADDYLSKPFFPDELLARIRAILRRTTHLPRVPQALRVGELCLLPGDRDVSFRGIPLGLTPMECEILERLMRFRGRVVSRDSLTLHLYNRLASPLDRSVDTHVSRIRRKLGSGRTMLLSIRGIGYQLRCPENPAAEMDKPAEDSE